MVLKIPKTILLNNKREELKNLLIELSNFWYSWIELWEIFDEKPNYMTSIRKHWKSFSISEKKCDLFIEKSKNLINSLKENNDITNSEFKKEWSETL